MTLSSTADRAVPAGAFPDSLVRAVRAEVRRGLDWQQTADRVAGVLRGNLPDPAVLLPAPLRRGDPACYQSHLLYAEPDGSFSISAMVWLPGQQTMIHDHVAWCVTGVLLGREYEEIFALTGGGQGADAGQDGGVEGELDGAADGAGAEGGQDGAADPPGDPHHDVQQADRGQHR